MKVDSFKNGLWVKLYPNKKIKEISFYVNGKLEGPFILFHENGFMKFESKIEGDEFYGTRTVYHDNGNIQNKGNFFNGIRDSIWEFYTYEGLLDKKILFSKGVALDTLIDNNLIPPAPPLSPSEKK